MKTAKKIIAIVLCAVSAILLLICIVPTETTMPVGSVVLSVILALACLFGALKLFGVFPGRKSSAPAARRPSAVRDPDVWITKDGNCYHNTLSCSAIGNSYFSIKRSEAVRRGYKPCSKCS